MFNSKLKFSYMKLQPEPASSMDGTLRFNCFDKNSTIAIVIMGSQLLIIGLVLMNGITNKFALSYKF